jgi:beta-galactosidase
MRMIRRAHTGVAAVFLVSAVSAAAGINPLQDAVLSADKMPRWGEESVTVISAARGEISLNGLWKFLPAEGPATRDPKVGWGYIKVPGNWKDGGTLVARGQGDPWKTWKPDESPAAWYERTIRVPADWKGRSILLDIDRVSTDAVVYVDGKEAAPARPRGR